MEAFIRNELLYGKDEIKKLQNSKVIIFGVGGVGGYVFEALIRMGFENIDIVDFDKVNLSNINRQIIATLDTIDMYKVDACINRAKSINKNAKINGFKMFFDENTASSFDFKKYDYIVDCIDSIKSKVELILKAKKEGVKIISSMGAGFKLDPGKVETNDIYKTTYCPLARTLRGQLKKLGVKDLKVVYSKEKPVKTKEETNGIVASSIFVPASFGLKIASVVVEDLLKP